MKKVLFVLCLLLIIVVSCGKKTVPIVEQNSILEKEMFDVMIDNKSWKTFLPDRIYFKKASETSNEWIVYGGSDDSNSISLSVADIKPITYELNDTVTSTVAGNVVINNEKLTSVGKNPQVGVSHGIISIVTSTPNQIKGTFNFEVFRFDYKGNILNKKVVHGTFVANKESWDYTSTY